ncbi:MAG: hypothetical protein ACJAS1_005142 [Oleiphilaceae bacterium]
MSNGTSSRLMDRIATLNYNVIRVVNKHPLHAQKYLNGAEVKVIIAPCLQKVICTKADEINVVKSLKEQFVGRLCEQDVSQIGFFKHKINFQNLDCTWVIQAVQKSDQGKLSENVFSTKSNVFWLIITTQNGSYDFHHSRIQKY